MLRLAKFVAVLACIVGTNCPSVSEAGVIPWAYDAVFGPVGSIQRSSYYTPYYAGYSGYTGASYLPASYSNGYASNGCSSCQQSSYYASTYGSCGCSPCGSACSSGCASGNCASGNCTANSIPTDGLRPVADPNNNSRGTESRGVESRLEAIERHLNIVPPRDHTGTRSRTYDDEFNATPRPRTRTDGLGSGNSIPARENFGTGTRRPAGSGTDAEGYSTPSVRTPAHGTNTDSVDDGAFRANPPARTAPDGASSGTRDTFKVNTEKSGSEKSDSAASDSSNAADADLVIPAKKPAATGTAIEGTNRPQTLPLDSRVTSKAVSPRERQAIAVGFQKPVIARAKTPAPAKNWTGNTKSTDLAQHR